MPILNFFRKFFVNNNLFKQNPDNSIAQIPCNICKSQMDFDNFKQVNPEDMVNLVIIEGFDPEKLGLYTPIKGVPFKEVAIGHKDFWRLCKQCWSPISKSFKPSKNESNVVIKNFEELKLEVDGRQKKWHENSYPIFNKSGTKQICCDFCNTLVRVEKGKESNSSFKNIPGQAIKKAYLDNGFDPFKSNIYPSFIYFNQKDAVPVLEEWRNLVYKNEDKDWVACTKKCYSLIKQYLPVNQ